MNDRSASSVRSSYDRLAPDYDRRWRHYVEATLRATLDGIEVEGEERTLDLACGTGTLEQRLLDCWPGLRIVGADLSRGMLSQAASKLTDGKVNWVQASSSRLPLADSSFDLALCANSFDYFRSPLEALAEIRRVLRPGGRFVLVDWCDDYLSCKACSIWLRWTDSAFHQTYSQAECENLLERSGLQPIASERFKIDWLWGLMRFVGCRTTSS
ncbi:class I SAM-dependent methyltransferase [Tautonia rosea]|uniref:class I SAM-dependent methyltransferase n=1 Tax=Tautonia rosea TaxID=2728037 RepID=UPI0014734E6D|nr:methyltransferase domain-containing protein [Tautonia rosea]